MGRQERNTPEPRPGTFIKTRQLRCNLKRLPPTISLSLSLSTPSREEGLISQKKYKDSVSRVVGRLRTTTSDKSLKVTGWSPIEPSNRPLVETGFCESCEGLVRYPMSVWSSYSRLKVEPSFMRNTKNEEPMQGNRDVHHRRGR